MGEHLDQAMAARRHAEEMREAMKIVKEEAKVLRTIAAGLAKEVVEAGSSLSTLHFTLYTLHFTLYTLHSFWFIRSNEEALQP